MAFQRPARERPADRRLAQIAQLQQLLGPVGGEKPPAGPGGLGELAQLYGIQQEQTLTPERLRQIQLTNEQIQADTGLRQAQTQATLNPPMRPQPPDPNIAGMLPPDIRLAYLGGQDINSAIAAKQKADADTRAALIAKDQAQQQGAPPSNGPSWWDNMFGGTPQQPETPPGYFPPMTQQQSRPPLVAPDPRNPEGPAVFDLPEFLRQMFSTRPQLNNYTSNQTQR